MASTATPTTPDSSAAGDIIEMADFVLPSFLTSKQHHHDDAWWDSLGFGAAMQPKPSATTAAASAVHHRREMTPTVPARLFFPQSSSPTSPTAEDDGYGHSLRSFASVFPLCECVYITPLP